MRLTFVCDLSIALSTSMTAEDFRRPWGDIECRSRAEEAWHGELDGVSLFGKPTGPISYRRSSLCSPPACLTHRGVLARSDCLEDWRALGVKLHEVSTLHWVVAPITAADVKAGRKPRLYPGQSYLRKFPKARPPGDWGYVYVELGWRDAQPLDHVPKFRYRDQTGDATSLPLDVEWLAQNPVSYTGATLVLTDTAPDRLLHHFTSEHFKVLGSIEV